MLIFTLFISVGILFMLYGRYSYKKKSTLDWWLFKGFFPSGNFKLFPFLKGKEAQQMSIVYVLAGTFWVIAVSLMYYLSKPWI